MFSSVSLWPNVSHKRGTKFQRSCNPMDFSLSWATFGPVNPWVSISNYKHDPALAHPVRSSVCPRKKSAQHPMELHNDYLQHRVQSWAMPDPSIVSNRWCSLLRLDSASSWGKPQFLGNTFQRVVQLSTACRLPMSHAYCLA